MDERLIDELLEAIWTCREKGEQGVDACLRAAHAEVDRETLEHMVDQGLVTVEDDQVGLTEKGEGIAAGIMRRHRLAERLFTDLLGMTVEQSEQVACSFEHVRLVPEVTDGLCTLLGHPRECPHGRPIPPGACCLEGRTEIERALTPLSEVPFGRSGRVAYVRPRDHQRLHMLMSMGIAPGVPLRVHQRTPVMVVTVAESEFAMDREVAKDVYVWLDPNG